MVVNPSYELCSSCPTITGQYHLCNNWLNCNGNIGPGLWGTPDYYHTCGTFHPTYNPVPPNTAIGTLNPHTGGAFMGLVCYNTPYPDYREYLSNQLSCPMNPGTTYTVSFWINCGTLPKYKYNTSHFGVYLSNTMPVQSGYGLINVTPQYEITTVISHTVWTQYSFTINPTSSFNYITLGCFKPDNAIVINNVTPNAQNPYSNWYIDDISVLGSGIQSTVVTTNASCNSSNGSATVTPIAGASYTWLPGNQNSNIVTGLAAGIYTVLISNGCSTDSKTVSISNSNSPLLSISNQTVCKSSIATLNSTVTGGTPPYSYNWSNGGSSASNTVLVNAPTILTCSVTDFAGCTSIKSVTVDASSIVSNFNFTLDNCKGKLFTTNSSLSSNSYTWNFGDGGVSYSVSPIHSYTLQGNYTITLISSNNFNCIDSIKKTVGVNAISNSLFTYTANLCDSVVQLKNNSVGSINFIWDFGDGFGSSASEPINHMYNSPGTYTISLISNPGGQCPDTSKCIVSMNYHSVANFSFQVNDCSSDIQFINLSQNTTNYLWNFGDASTSNISDPLHSYNNSSILIYTVSLIVNANSSCADTIKKTVILKSKTTADFNFYTDICNGITTFTNTSLNATSYYWLFDGKSYSNFKDPQYDFGSSGTHTVLLIANSSGLCRDTLIKVLQVTRSTVNADFNYEMIEYSNEINFINQSTNGNWFLWDFNDGSSTNNENPTHQFEELNNIKVCLAAKNEFGCGDTICKLIDVKLNWTLYIPNTFTPDNNGLNDILYAIGTNIKQFDIRIFDRWGEELFHSDKIVKGWDGTYKGKLVQDDVYVWIANFTDSQSKNHQLTGHVMVLK